MSTLTDFDEIPVVDVTGLYGSAEQQEAVAEQLGRAAREVGFLYVTGHDVPPEYFDALLTVAQDFFAQPLEKKMEVYIGKSSNHRGYVPVGEEGDMSEEGRKKPPNLKEAFDSSLDLPADDADYLAGNPMVGPNQWPDLPGLQDTVTRYYQATLAFGKVLLRGFALALGEPADAFDHLVQRAPSQLRLIHYPYDESAVDIEGIGAHTDFEIFTLLRPTAPGLQVLNGAGRWIEAPPRDGAFVVNIADMLEVWSNGAFVSTTHRVRQVAEERYSFPLFFNADYDVVVAPLERFRRQDGTDKVSLKAGEHLYAQTIYAFAYLQDRLSRGQIAVPDGSVPDGSFGREAILKRAESGADDPTLVRA